MSNVVRSVSSGRALALGFVLHACAASREGGDTTGPVGTAQNPDGIARAATHVNVGLVGVSDDDTQPPPPQQELAFAAQQVFDALAAKHAALVTCYRDAIQSRGVAEGIAKFVLSVDAKGAVTRAVQSEGSTSSAELTACARDTLTGVSVQNVPAEGLEAALEVSFVYAANATLWTLDPIRIGKHSSAAMTPTVTTGAPGAPPTGRRRRPRAHKSFEKKDQLPPGSGPVNTSAQIRSVLVAQLSALDACAGGVPAQASGTPSLAVAFVIDTTGKVSWAKLESSEANGNAAWACVERTVRGATFPNLGASAQRVRVTFPISQ